MGLLEIDLPLILMMRDKLAKKCGSRLKDGKLPWLRPCVPGVAIAIRKSLHTSPSVKSQLSTIRFWTDSLKTGAAGGQYKTNPRVKGKP